MGNVVWGDEIAITNNTKPDWLDDKQSINAKWKSCGLWSGLGLGYTFANVAATSDGIIAIRLPADHPHYAREFKVGDYVVATPTHGNMCDLTEGKAYLIEDGLFIRDDVGSLRRTHSNLYRPATPAEIAEYLAEHALEAQYKGEPLLGVWVDPDDAPEMTAADLANATAELNGERLEMVGQISTMMLLPMMTREECLAKADEKEWASPNTSRMAYLHAYEDLGLIREVAPPTDLERYKAETGAAIGGIEDAIEAAIKWARENS